MLEFHIEDKGSRSYWVSFSGSFDDQCTRALGELHSKLAPSRVCVFNFREVENLNSLGIRSWINFLRSFEEGRQIIFEDCTPDVISQINTLPKFTSHSRIATFFAYYVCDSCGKESEKHYDVSKGYEAIIADSEQTRCECGEIMDLEGDEDIYFEFLNVLKSA